jgi:hypothetical protein
MLALANILFLPPPSVVIYISLQSKSKVGDAAVLPPVIIKEFTGKGITYYVSMIKHMNFSNPN